MIAWHSQGDYDKYQNSDASDMTMRLLKEVALGEITSHLVSRGFRNLWLSVEKEANDDLL